MKPTLQPYFVIAVALLASGLAVRTWTIGTVSAIDDSLEELPVVVLRHADQSTDQPANSIPDAATIATRFSTKNMVQPVVAQAASIVWDSEIIVEQTTSQTANHFFIRKRVVGQELSIPTHWHLILTPTSLNPLRSQRCRSPIRKCICKGSSNPDLNL